MNRFPTGDDRSIASDLSRMTSIDNRLTAAARQHQAGRLDEAEQVYRAILATNPQHITALQCLGILGLQSGRPAVAVEMFDRALTIDDRMPECHHNLALALRALGRLDEAISHYQSAISFKPDHVEAHVNLANALVQRGRFEEAFTSYRRAIDLNPHLAQAHSNLGTALLGRGRTEEAMIHLRRAVTLDPNLSDAHLGIGDALLAGGRLDEAAAQFERALAGNPNSATANHRRGLAFLLQHRPGEAVPLFERAVALRPNFIEAHENWAQALFSLGRVGESLGVLRHAIHINATPRSRFLFIQFLQSLDALPADDDFRNLITKALAESWDRPRNIEPIAAILLKQDTGIRDALERVTQAWPRRLPEEELLGPKGLAAISGQSVLVQLLQSAPVCDIGLERLLTSLRFIALQRASAASHSTPVDEAILGFCCALARQCFLNEYILAQTGDELAQATRLAEALQQAILSGEKVCELKLAVSGAYFPLHTLPGTHTLLERRWPTPVADLLNQQIGEPGAERDLLASIPTLTAIDDAISRAVQRQYEENPYPRWQRAESPGEPRTIDQLLRGRFPLASFREIGGGAVDVLIAGCGTGQQAIEFAQQVMHERMLAIDLSRASLAYAKRKASSYAVEKIEFAQADILKLPSIDRTFDLILVSGVLHHMQDPFAGWRALVALLRPSGVMYVGLYSELARSQIKAARAFIARRGFRPTLSDIRLCRQEIMELPDGELEKNVVRFSDFFSASECRDLLFHVQEHRHTLPQIAAFLSAHDLTLLGFDLPPAVSQRYAARFPVDRAMTDLSLWEVFEQENPQVFVGMYQFWVQKRHR